MMIDGALALQICVAAPALAAVALFFVPAGARNLIRGISLVGAVASLAFAVLAALHYDRAQAGIQLVSSIPLVPSLGIALTFGTDGWSLPLLLLTGVILTTGVCASWDVQERPRDFFALLLLLSAGVCGVFASLDLFVFFLCYEIAVLPMYLLIAIWGTSNKVKPAGPLAFAMRTLDVGGKEYAAMKLTLMLLVGSALVLAAMLGLYVAAGSQSFDLRDLAKVPYAKPLQLWAFAALWIGFGSLAGVWPFHTWSPDGHAAAPTAVSMLHAGVLMKLGAYGVVRVGMVLLPDGARDLAWLVGTVATVNIVWGALSAMAQQDLKYIVAYSSVSHMGVVMLGAATLTVNGWNGAVFQMVAHGLMTGLFFALVGLVYGRAHNRWVPDMGGFGQQMPGVAVCFTIACLSSLGLPGLAGFAAEFLVFLGAWQGGQPVWAIAGLIGAFLTAVYVLRATKRVFWGPPSAHPYPDLRDASGTEWVALATLVAALVVLGVWPRLTLDLIDVGTMDYLPAVAGKALESLR
jgi:NADH-quinone oxidoreductase subunit M